jgi:hypothetical protein
MTLRPPITLNGTFFSCPHRFKSLRRSLFSVVLAMILDDRTQSTTNTLPPASRKDLLCRLGFRLLALWCTSILVVIVGNFNHFLLLPLHGRLGSESFGSPSHSSFPLSHVQSIQSHGCSRICYLFNAQSVKILDTRDRGRSLLNYVLQLGSLIPTRALSASSIPVSWFSLLLSRP